MGEYEACQEMRGAQYSLVKKNTLNNNIYMDDKVDAF
jgi:hypothetical protein